MCHVKTVYTAWLAVFMIAALSVSLDAGDRFRSFNEDRFRFDRVIERACQQPDLDAWNEYMDQASSALRAEWEREADYVIESECRSAGDTGLRLQLVRQKSTASAEWERGLESAIAEEKGRWYADRQNLLYIPIDRERIQALLEESVQGGDTGATGLADRLRQLDEAEQMIFSEYGFRWESSIGELFESARMRGDLLDEKARTVFLHELEKEEEEFKERLRVERAEAVLSGRNRIIHDAMIDDGSLRSESENESAETVADRILSATLLSLDREEKAIAKPAAFVSRAPADFDVSIAGKSWMEEITQLLEQGNKQWERAFSGLSAAINQWRDNAAGGVVEGEKKWREAYQRIEAAREAWRERISGEIDSGIEQWQKSEDELAAQIEESRLRANEYLGLQREQWAEYSQQLARLADEGFRSVINSESSLLCYTENSNKYRATGFYSGSFTNSSANPQDAAKFSDLYERLNPQVRNSLDAARAMYPEDDWSVKTGEKCWSSKYNIHCENQYDDYIRRFFPEPGISISPVLESAEFDPATGRVTETYSVTITVLVAAETNTSQNVVTALNYYSTSTTLTNVITPETPPDKKSRFYYYVTEAENWKSILSSSTAAFSEMEKTLHDKNILGLDSGQGFLANTDNAFGLKYDASGGLENDPYLMTLPEMRYEYARRDREFWQKRLVIAQDVLKYASPELFLIDNEFAPNGMREEKFITEQRVNSRKEKMTVLKSEYDTLRAGITEKVTAIRERGLSVSTITGGLAGRESIRTAAREAYEEARQKAMQSEAAGGADGETLKDVEAKGTAFHEADTSYNAFLMELSSAREAYDLAVKEYSEMMNHAAAKYRDYKTAEFEYERAVAVWEYANTPYLGDSATRESSLGGGMLANGSEVNYSDITPPDVRENYDYFLSLYEAADERFQSAGEALQSQETVEDLAIDGRYNLLRENLRKANTALIDRLFDGVDNETREGLISERAAALEAYRAYCARSEREGLHDGTVLLRDEEALLWEALGYAKGKKCVEAYARIVRDLVSDGESGSVDDRIIARYSNQRIAYQEQAWEQQQVEVFIRRNRWLETISFINARGERTWTAIANDMKNRWTRWRSDQDERISEGEKEWGSAVRDLQRDVLSWNKNASREAVAEGAKRISEDVSGLFESGIKNVINTIQKSSVRIDPLSPTYLYPSLMKSVSSLGIFNSLPGMFEVSAGLTDLPELGISGGMFQQYERQFERFNDRMEVMQSVMIGEFAYDAFTAMLAQFNKQVEEANRAVAEQVKTGIRDADPFVEAPFERGNGFWKIRYVSDYSLVTGRTYQQYMFSDYSAYVNTTVFLRPARGIGGTIDFSNPYSYERMMPDEINLYATMEKDRLGREIEKVFGAGGTFELHSKEQFETLGKKFTEGYTRYAEGEVMSRGAWYRTPIVPNGPDPMTVTRVAGSIALSTTLGPWAAFALNMALTGVDVADGTTAWKHAGVQVAVGAASTAVGGIGGQVINMAASGIDYEQDGDIGWSNRNLRQGMVRGAVSMMLAPTLQGAMGEGSLATVLSTGATTFVTNSVQAGNGWKGLYNVGWDEDNWQQHLTEGTASGITAGLTRPDAQGNPSTGDANHPSPNVYGDQFVNKAISGGLHSTIMMAGYHAFGGQGFENSSFGKFNYSSMTYSPYDLGAFLGAKLNTWTTENASPIFSNSEKNENAEKSWTQYGIDVAAKAIEVSNNVDRSMKNFFNAIGKSAVDGIKNFGTSAYIGIHNLFTFNSASVAGTEERKQWWGRGTKGEWSPIEKDMVERYSKNPEVLKKFMDVLIAIGYSEEEKNKLYNLAKDMSRVIEYNENKDKNFSPDKDGISSPKSHRDYADYFDAKMRLSKEMGSEYDITEEDKSDLVRTVMQKSGYSLSQEVFDAIKGNESYRKMLEGKGVNLNSEQDIRNYANSIAHDACVNANLWVSLKAAGANVESYYGDFYMKNVERGDLVKDSSGLIINARNDGWGIDYQRVANNYSIDGNKIEVVRGSDYNSFLNDMSKYDVVVRGTWGHNMSIIGGNLYDTGLGRRDWGGDPSIFIERKNISSYYYLRVKK